MIIFSKSLKISNYRYKYKQSESFLHSLFTHNKYEVRGFKNDPGLG